MAMVDCLECQKKVSTKAANCPHCGAPVDGVGLEQALERQAAKKARGTKINSWILVGVVLVIAAIAIFSPESFSVESEEDQRLQSLVLPANANFRAHMEKFLRDGYGLDRVFVIRSQTHKRALYVAASASGPGTQLVGTWIVSGSMNDPGIVTSLDAGATVITVVELRRSTLDNPAPAFDSDPEAVIVRQAAVAAMQTQGGGG